MDNKSANEPTLFGSNAYSPAEIQAKVEQLGVKKAHMPFLPELVLSVVAGGSIGLGGMFFCIVLGDPSLSYAPQRLLGGIVFTLGLALVMIAGAELFTGNCLIVMAWANKQISTGEVLKNWTLVWFGNLIGALGLVFLLWMCHFPDLNGGNVGLGMLKLAISKVTPDATTIFFKGVMCNILVCLGVWLAYAGRSVSDKIMGMLLPVAAFVAAGFEHCIANMFFLPMAWLMVEMGHAPAGLDVSAITAGAIVHNLIFATLGNIVGGSGFVGVIYWIIYRKGLGGVASLPKSSADTLAAAE